MLGISVHKTSVYEGRTFPPKVTTFVGEKFTFGLGILVFKVATLLHVHIKVQCRFVHIVNVH